MTFWRSLRPGLVCALPAAVALGLIGACLLVEASVLRVGIDDLDEGYFVQQAARVLHGQVPYRDFETLYTPGLVSLHAFLLWVFGGPYVLAPRALALLARSAVAITLYALTRPLVRRPVWAAVPSLFLLLGLDDAPERWEPHPGWLSSLFALLAAWGLGHGPSMRWLVGSGAAAGLAYLFKQNTGAFILAAILTWGALSDCLPGSMKTGSQRNRGRISATVLGWPRLVAPLAAFAAVTLAWLVPLLIAGAPPSSLGGFVGAVDLAGLSAPPEPSIGIPLLCLAGGVWLARRSDVDPRLRWYVLAGAALFCSQYPRMDTLHLAWSAPLLLVVGAVVLDRVRPLAASQGILVGSFLLTGSLLPARVDVLLQPRVPLADVPFASEVEVPPRTAAELEGVVDEIQRRTQPGEPIFVYPTSPLLYALADRPNPTRFDHLNPGAASARQIDGVLVDLQAANVKLVVISDFWQTVWGPPGPNAPLVAWLDGRFAEVARYGAYRVLVPGL